MQTASPIMQQTTTTTSGLNTFQPAAPANVAYYDRPADKRIRPWVLLGDLLLTCIGIGMIITSVAHYGSLHSLWGFFAAGCALALAGIIGLVCHWTLRPALLSLAFFSMVILWLAAIAILIVNACFLNSNANGQCASHNFARFSNGCENVRQYHIVVYSVFGPLVAMWTPALLVAAGYLWRTSALYRKQEYNANTLPLPIGTSRM